MQKKLEVLITTMNRGGISFLSEMKVASDCVVSNQADRSEEKLLSNGEKSVLFITTPERGVSRARNLLIGRSGAEIILFADDDLVFSENYEEKILSEFDRLPSADGIKFGYASIGGEKFTYNSPEKPRVAKKNELMSTGVLAFAIKRKALLDCGVMFDESVGPGSDGEIESGEDSLFFADLLSRGVRIYRSPVMIAALKNCSSSWYRGMDEKFFLSKGRLYHRLYGGAAAAAAIRFTLVHGSLSPLPRRKMLALMLRGIKKEKELKPD